VKGGATLKALLKALSLITLLIFTGCGGGGGSSSSAEFVPILANSTASIAENASSGDSVGNITISDVGDSAISSITLSGTGSSNFTVATNGAITVSGSATLDYETLTTYNLTAIATNTAGNSASKTVTITVTNIAEIPIIQAFTGSIDENATIGTAVGNIIIDSHGDNTISSFTLSDTTNFEINTTGYIKSKTTLNYEANTIYNLTAIATNTVGNSTSVNVIININNIGDHYILSAVYDNNRTSSVLDDILYLYFDQNISSDSISSTINNNYTITGTGAIGSASTGDYNSSLFYRHKISLNSDGTASIELNTSDDTNISLASNVITDIDGNFPEDYNQTNITAFNPLGRLKTGQTTTYVEFDDGNTTRGITRSYTDNGDTVTDNATGLIWQQEDDNTERTWADAGTYCDGLTLDGNSDFRLPTIEELVSITDKQISNPSINAIFTNTNSSGYWSATTGASGTSDAWYVYFNGGDDGWRDKTVTYFVRCVRLAD